MAGAPARIRGVGIAAPENLFAGRPRTGERAIEWGLRLAAGVSIVISLLIVVSLVGNAAQFLRSIELSSLWSDGWFPRRSMFDIKTIVGGTFLITIIAMVLAVPAGLGAAVYLAEYASTRSRRFIKPSIELLAGIPSVVVGFFALTWISPNIVARLCEGPSAFNMTAAGLGVGILVTPLIASIADDALRAVPHHLRESAQGLGARKGATTLRVVMPAATSGLTAAVILGVSRAIGETMVVAIAAGATGGALFSLTPCGSGQSMTAAMTSLAVGSDQVSQAGAFESLFFVGLLLFVMTLVLNLVGAFLSRGARDL